MVLYAAVIALVLGGVGLVLGAIALFKLRKTNKELTDLRERIRHPENFPQLLSPNARRRADTGFGRTTGFAKQSDDSLIQKNAQRSNTHERRIADLERQIKSITTGTQSESRAGDGTRGRGKGRKRESRPSTTPAAGANISADGNQPGDPISNPPTQREIIYLLYTDTTEWPAGAATAQQLDSSMFRVELKTPTTGEYRMIPGSQRLRDVLAQPTDYPTPALTYVQQGSQGELAQETPGQVMRTGDGGWRVVRPVHIVIA